MTRRQGALVETAAGKVGVVWAERRLERLYLPEEDEGEIVASLTAWSGSAPFVDTQSHLSRQLRAYYEGKKVNLSLIPVNLDWATPFARSVYEALRTVPWGQTVSYGELAKMIGQPGVARGVGSALGANRIPLVIPCHRVVASDGRLTGFSAAGGIDTKRRMLILEGIAVP